MKGMVDQLEKGGVINVQHWIVTYKFPNVFTHPPAVKVFQI